MSENKERQYPVITGVDMPAVSTRALLHAIEGDAVMLECEMTWLSRPQLTALASAANALSAAAALEHARRLVPGSAARACTGKPAPGDPVA